MKPNVSKPIVCMAGQKPRPEPWADCREDKCRTCGHNLEICLIRAITYFTDGMTTGPDGMARLIVPKP